MTSGGGVTFLQMLEYTRAHLNDGDKAQSMFTTTESLWRAGGEHSGPLSRSKANGSSALVDDFTDRGRPVICTYEHHALALVTRARDLGEDDVVAFRTRPAAELTQKLLVLSDRGQKVATRIVSPQGHAALTARGLRIHDEDGTVRRRLEEMHRYVEQRVQSLTPTGPSIRTETWNLNGLDVDRTDATALVDAYVRAHPDADVH